MAIIGTFTATGDRFDGTIETFTSAMAARFEPTGAAEGVAAPGYRVFRGASEIGAAWTRRTKARRRYLLVRIDDPAWSRPIECRLVQAEQGWLLMWSRE